MHRMSFAKQLRTFAPQLSAAVRTICCWIAGVCLLPMSAFSADFTKDVAPVFRQRCLGCHNDEARQGDFSLQTKSSALESGMIIPGDATNSHLLDVITPAKGKAQMPKNAAPLTTSQRRAIHEWIESGAAWPDGLRLEEQRVTDFDWWSYQPVANPPVPRIDSTWIRNPVDAFILQTLGEMKLSPSPEADRRTLIRRLSFDLIGLPPTPEDVAQFVADKRPDAYDKLVDRLLDSPHYGERWARHWLDVVKYADTCGYDKDKLRPNAWPYRDYVIRSLNNDKPYSRFIREQIAGDAFFPGESDGILGLGFLAAGPWDFIGHVEVPESKLDGKVARNLDRDDMVANTLNTFCSVTVQCARCHNHKFDPITQADYYGLQSVFAAIDRADRTYDSDPQVEQKRQTFVATRNRYQKELKQIADEKAAAGGMRLAELNKQIERLGKLLKVQKTPQFGYHSAISKTQNVSKWVAIDLGRATSNPQIILQPAHDEFANIGAGFGFPIRFVVETSVDAKTWRTVLDHSKRDFPNPGLAPVTATAKGMVRHIRITANKLAERKSDYILALAEVRVLDVQKRSLTEQASVSSLDSIEAPVRWSRKNLVDNEWSVSGDAVAAQQFAQLNAERRDILARIETPARKKRQAELRKKLADVQQALAKLPAGKMVYAATTTFKPQGNFKPTNGKLRTIHVLNRGNIDQPGAIARPTLLPLNAKDKWEIDAGGSESDLRARFAESLTAREHPLVWRSIVNRVWQNHFGTGIVSTPNDFGRMGARPTHPELLDWLATNFRDGGQSLKSLHRLIVTSSTYRQSSRDVVANRVIDSGNQFLWRMNRRRLSAEEIRDAILSVSGTLNPQMYGPGFYLFALEKTAHSPHYEYHKFDPADPKSHRRSVYRFIVRSQPDPWMTTLDCADSSQSTPTRNETLTSLQALSLLNSQFNLVMAERFAARLEQEKPAGSQQAGTIRQRVARAFELAVQRQPSPQELTAMESYARKHGLKNLARFVFNLNEFVFVD